jgi:hypothetical protein
LKHIVDEHIQCRCRGGTAVVGVVVEERHVAKDIVVVGEEVVVMDVVLGVLGG